jgi:Rrf2 family protein
MELSQDTEQVLSAGQIAGKYGISEHHISKVLQHLKRTGFIRSIRGIHGGFKIARPPGEITVMDIVDVFEPSPQNDCILSDIEQQCPGGNACRIGELFNEINEQAYYTLKSISFATLISRKRILQS